MTVPYAPGRTFTVKVSELQPNQKMVWSDGFAPMFQGVRTLLLEPASNAHSLFRMSERFSGLMLPLIAPQLPDFVPVFERYAEDLRKAAES